MFMFNFLINLTTNENQKNNFNSGNGGIQNNLKSSTIKQYFTNISWLENSNFSSPTIDPWYNTTKGDSTDIRASVSKGQADYIVIGNEGRKEISNVFQDSSKWTPFKKSDLELFPDNYDVDSEGAWCDHYYDEDANQFPKIYWRYNVSMGLDMSDYEITSTEIEATINASVDANFDVEGDNLAHVGDGIESRDLFDSIYYSIEVSDMNLSPLNTYLIAENRTTNLGDDVAPTYLSIPETSLTFSDPKDIAFYIQRVLQADPGNDNFTIILGISIVCADNSDEGDIDEVLDARFKSLNLTFTYKKKIDLGTALAWNQEGAMINYTSVQVTEAKLNFEYKIDKNWSTTTNYLAENSEFRIIINGNHQEKYPTTKLSSANGTFQIAREEPYELTNLIPLEENITLSIEVFIGDDFNLDQSINISIDNILFNISYIVFTPTPPGGALPAPGGGNGGKDIVREEPWINLLILIAAIAGAIGIGTYLVAYQLFLKYPKPVRKVRKYRKTLKKKKAPSVDITSRENAFNDKFKELSLIAPSLVKTAKPAKPIKKPVAPDKKPTEKKIEKPSEKKVKKPSEKKTKKPSERKIKKPSKKKDKESDELKQ